MNSTKSRLTALLCLFAVLVSMCAFAMPTMALGSDVANIDNTPLIPEHDISVMSFNTLDYDTHSTGYLQPIVRADYIVETVKKYSPDLLGIQEAADAKTSNGNFDWNDFYKEEFGKLGYEGRQLTEETVKPGSMTIGAGLMIFWKKDRFTYDSAAKDAHGSVQFNNTFSIKNSNGTITGSDTDRYFHWVRLLDKQHGNLPIFMFNTHFTINSSNAKLSDAEKTTAGNIMRTAEAAQMSAKMKSVSGNSPCFSTGDYNCKFSASKTAEENNRQLCNMVEGTGLADSSQKALNSLVHRPDDIIDHVFYKTACNMPLEAREINEEHEGYRPSDHRAVISYMNYLSPISFASGSYVAKNRTFTDTSASTSYTFNTTLPSPYTLKIFDENGKEVTTKVTLTKLTSHYTISVYLGGILFHNITAEIVCSAIKAPAITASGVSSAYFAAGAYYVTMTTAKFNATIEVENSSIYRDAACTNLISSSSFKNIAQGVTNYYAKTAVGVFPLYICRENAKPTENVYYVDDDFVGAPNGTVPFIDGASVMLLQLGTNAFPTITAAAAAAPENATVRVAGGRYTEDITLTKALNFIGNNADIMPFVRKDQNWTLSNERKEESVLVGAIIYNMCKDYSFAVKGFTFDAEQIQSNRGAISVTTSASISSMLTKTVTLDIQNNRFLSRTTSTSSCSDINVNNALQKKGIVAGNYFKENAYLYNVRQKRAMTGRNFVGLTFENNYFVDFVLPIWCSSEVTNANTSAGNNHITFAYNRLENCGDLYTATTNVYNGTSADVKYLYNDFVRCGHLGRTTPAYIAVQEVSGKPIDYANVSVLVMGNRFINCYRDIIISRTSNLQSDMRNMKLSITQNKIFYPYALDSINSTINMNVRINATDYGVRPDWDCSYNFVTSPAVPTGDIMKFVKAPTSGEGVPSIDLESLVTPFYTTSAMTNKSDGGYAAVQNIQPSVKTVHPGMPVTIDFNGISEDSFVSYSTDKDSGRAYSLTGPVIDEIGKVTVYYQVERPGYQLKTGQVFVPIDHTEDTTKLIVDQEPTATADGYGHYACSVCGQITTANVPIPANHEHKWDAGKITTQPTCAATGIKTYTCTVCGTTKTETVAATGMHTWDAGKITKQPTETATGIKTYTCTVCGTTKTETVPKLTPAGGKDAAMDFKDVRTKDWFYKAVNYAYNEGLFGGTTATTFEPNTNMTRGMFVTVLGRLAGVSGKGQVTKFTDVKKSAYYSGYVKWASDKGIVSGTSATKFEPEANVNREQICKMMVEYCKAMGITLVKSKPEIKFADAAKISKWARDYVKTCQMAGLVNGKEHNCFDPAGNATRAEVATILYNFNQNYGKN